MERRQKLTGKQNITVTFNDSPHHVRQSGSGIQGISRILEIFFFLNPRILSFGIRNSVQGIPNPANDWKPEFLKFTKLRSQLDCHIMWHYLACKSYVNKHQLKCYQPHLPELCLSFRVAVKTNTCSLKRYRVVHCSSLACFVFLLLLFSWLAKGITSLRRTVASNSARKMTVIQLLAR